MKTFHVEFRKENSLPIKIQADRLKVENNISIFLSEPVAERARVVAVINNDSITQIIEQ